MQLVVIGAGPGGYVAAIRAAQLGARVTLVERDRVGGTCLNRGCIPTKTLLHATGLLEQLQSGADYGVTAAGITFDYARAVEKKDSVVRQLVGGVELLLRKNGVNCMIGEASLVDKSTVLVRSGGKQEALKADRIILATGSAPMPLPLPGMDLPQVLDSTGALALTQVPKRLVIVGGGVIGVELATIFAAAGARVEIIELLPALVSAVDAEIGAILTKRLMKNGVALRLGSRLLRVEQSGTGVRVHFARDGKETAAEADRVLVSIGRRANTEGLGLEPLGVRTEQGRIPVSEYLETSVPGIYAIGDLKPGLSLAHTASHEGLLAAANALGAREKVDQRVVPACIFTRPEIGTVGLTEEQARAQGHDVLVGRFPYGASGRALSMNEAEGLVKVVADKRYGEVLGVHVIGAHASDLIHEGALAMQGECTLETIGGMIHAHPTLSEMLMEAALDCTGQALHIPPRGPLPPPK